MSSALQPVCSSKSLFDNHCDLNPFVGTPHDEIYIQIARLQLEVLQLYCDADAINHTEFVRLFATAIELIISVESLNDSTKVTAYAPSYLTTSMILAAFTVLRMATSHFGQLLDRDIREKGKSALFIAINLLKRISLMNNDVCALAASFLSAMWTNQAFFKTSDNSSWCKLRIRNRLSMSVVFDSILVWIETYGCIDVVPARLLRPSDGTTIRR